MCDSLIKDINNATYTWYTIPVIINYENFSNIVSKLSNLHQLDKISYTEYPPLSKDIYIMEYSILQSAKRWWYSDSRWKTYELIELLLYNGCYYEYSVSGSYNKAFDITEKLVVPYKDDSKFTDSYNDLVVFISKYNHTTILSYDNLKLIDEQSHYAITSNNMDIKSYNQFFLGTDNSGNEQTSIQPEIQELHRNIHATSQKTETEFYNKDNNTHNTTIHADDTNRNINIFDKTISADGKVSTTRVYDKEDYIENTVYKDIRKHPYDKISHKKQIYSKVYNNDGFKSVKKLKYYIDDSIFFTDINTHNLDVNACSCNVYVKGLTEYMR